MNVNVLIVEDEAHTSALLQEIIEQNDHFIVTQITESVVDTVHYLSKNQKKLDLLFFDIQLADGKSFEIFKNIDVEIPVIFCTAFEDYSLDAIKNNGIDYVLKPFKDQEIHQALEKFLRLRNTIQAKYKIQNFISEQNEKKYQQNFLGYHKDKATLIDVRDVALFSLEYETVYLYTLQEKKYPLYKKLEYFESVCDPDQFFRVNRQMLVHRNTIVSFEPYFNRKIILGLKIKINENVVVSRLKVNPFKVWLENKL